MKNVLIIKTHAIGDVVMTTPAIRALRKAFPGATISILVGKWSASIVKNNINIDNIITFDDKILFKKDVFKVIGIIRHLRKRKFDAAIIFHPSPFIHLLALFAGIKRRLGLRRNNRGWFLTEYIDENSLPDFYYPLNFLNLLSKIGIKSSDYTFNISYNRNEKEKMLQLFHSYNITSDDKKIILAPGGSHNPKESIKARQWPKEFFVDLLGMINNKYPHYKVLICGSDNDKYINQYIMQRINFLIDFTGKTSLTELAFVIESSTLTICNDSSILHISIAMNTPVQCFFGPTSLKSRVPPEKSRYSIQSQIDCSPCYTYAIFQGCSRGYECMKSIKPKDAFERIDKLIGAK